MDRESVITHLQIIHTWAEFARERDLQFFTPKHLTDIAQWADDTIELLKEQEAVEPIPYHRSDGTIFKYECKKCRTKIFKMDLFCRHCGRSVKWE